MSISAQPLGEPPISAQPPIPTTGTKPPRKRQTIARADASLTPEAR